MKSNKKLYKQIKLKKMDIQQIENQLNKLTELKNKAKRDITETYRKKWAVSDKTRISRINESFYSIDCNSFEDFKNVLKNCSPYQNSHRIKHGATSYDICSPFKFTIKNGFYKRELKFEFIKINDTIFWVSIDFKKIPDNIVDVFFTSINRKLYSTESHYINIPSHYKKFKNYRVESLTFCSQVLNWYGGVKTILDTSEFKGLLTELKK